MESILHYEFDGYINPLTLQIFQSYPFPAIFKHMLLNLMQSVRHNYSRVSFIRLRRPIRCKRELFRIHVVNFNRVSDPFSTTPDDYNMLIFSIRNSCTAPPFVFKAIEYTKWRYTKGSRTINISYYYIII